MTIYTCSRCHKDFYLKANYTSHINRKFPCEATPRDQNHTCHGCGKEFASHFSMLRHQSKGACKAHSEPGPSQSPERVCQGCGKEFASHQSMVKHQSRGACKTVLELKQGFLALKAEAVDLKAELAALKAESGSKNTFNINVDNSINTVNNTICVGPNSGMTVFGEEDPSKIPHEIRMQILQSPSYFMEYFKMTHLNPETPEQHNMKYTNRRDNAFQVVGKDGQLQTILADTAFGTVSKGASSFVDFHKDEKELTPENRTRLKSICDMLTKPHVDGEAKAYKNSCISQVKRAIYDKRKMVVDTMKRLM